MDAPALPFPERLATVTCDCILQSGVALTDTQKSEYWTMPYTYSFSLEFFHLLSSLSHAIIHITDFCTPYFAF
jgi:hypothetical protein